MMDKSYCLLNLYHYKPYLLINQWSLAPITPIGTPSLGYSEEKDFIQCKTAES